MIALIIKTFTDFLTSLQKAQQARADYWILTNMSDKELHDIGIARGEINRVVSEALKQSCITDLYEYNYSMQ